MSFTCKEEFTFNRSIIRVVSCKFLSHFYGLFWFENKNMFYPCRSFQRDFNHSTLTSLWTCSTKNQKSLRKLSWETLLSQMKRTEIAIEYFYMKQFKSAVMVSQNGNIDSKQTFELLCSTWRLQKSNSDRSLQLRILQFLCISAVDPLLTSGCHSPSHCHSNNTCQPFKICHTH